MKLDNLNIIYVGNTLIGKIYLGDNLVYQKESPIEIEPLCFTCTSKTTSTTIKLELIGTPVKYTSYNFKTSKDGSTWTNYTVGDTITIDASSCVYFKGNNTALGESDDIYKHFVGSAIASGNIQSLLGLDTEAPDYAFVNLFKDASTISVSVKLPATKVGKACYKYFAANARSHYYYNLPATELAEECYYGMYDSPRWTYPYTVSISATKMAKNCCAYMFRNTGINGVTELHTENLAEGCFAYMLEGNAFTTNDIPALPATTLYKDCYAGMFKNNTAMESAPELPATTLAEGCYAEMFSGCSDMNYIKCLATDISAEGCTTNWTSGVASSGNFIKSAEMTSWTTGADGIPEGWTVRNDGAVPYTLGDALTTQAYAADTLFGIKKSDDSAIWEDKLHEFVAWDKATQRLEYNTYADDVELLYEDENIAVFKLLTAGVIAGMDIENVYSATKVITYSLGDKLTDGTAYPIGTLFGVKKSDSSANWEDRSNEYVSWDGTNLSYNTYGDCVELLYEDTTMAVFKLIAATTTAGMDINNIYSATEN